MPKFEMLNSLEGVRPVVTREGESKGVWIEEVYLPLLKLANVMVGWMIHDPEEGDKFYSPVLGWTNPPRRRNATA